MKDKRIVAALSQFSLPPERRAAVLARILEQAHENRAEAGQGPEPGGASRLRERASYSGATRLAGPAAPGNGGARRKAKGAQARKRASRRGRALRVLAPAAAVLLVCAALFSIPSVSRAVRSFFIAFFRIDAYLTTPPAERSPNPDYEEMITTPDPEAQSYSVRYLDETEHYAGVDEYRVKAGFKAFDRADYAWIADIVPRVSEILYDGRNFYMTSFINVSPLRFAGVYGAEGEGVERMDMSMWEAVISHDGQSYPYACGSSGTQIDAFYDRDARAFDMDAMRAAEGMYVMTELSMNESPALPSGEVQIELSYAIYDGNIDDMATVGMVAIVTQRFSFDTSAANEGETRVTLPETAFTGTLPVTIARKDTPEAGYTTYENKTLDFSRLTVTPVLVRRATELQVELYYSSPADWDEAAFRAVTRQRLSRKNGLQYELILDGQSCGMPEMAYAGGAVSSVIIPFTKTELAEARSLILRPVWSHASHILFNEDAPISLETPYVLAPRGPGSYYWDVTDVSVTLQGCDIELPLS